MTRLGGWCLDGHCNDCRYPSCTHEHHTHAAEMVAQTFDRGALNGPETVRIAVGNKSAPRVRKHQARSLTASKERLHE